MAQVLYGAPPEWSPQLQQLFEAGVKLLLQQLDARPPDGVWCIGQPEPGKMICGWQDRREVLRIAAATGRRFLSLEADVPQHHVRVVVTTPEEEAVCRVPLDTLRKETSPQREPEVN